MSIGFALVFTAVFLGVNAFFVSAEFAVTSSRRAQVEPLVAEQRPGSAQALYALEHVSLMLAICQLGITVMSTSLGVLAEPAFARLFAVPLTAAGLPEATAHVFAFVAALVLILLLHVVFGEMVPKNISIANPQKVLLWLAPALVALGRVLGPIVRAMDRVANGFLRMIGVEPSAEISATFTAEEVAQIVEVSHLEGKLSDELGLISGTLEFSTENAGDVMVRVEDLQTLPADVTPTQVEQAVAQTGYSRFPVSSHPGDLVGYLHLKDVLYADDRTRDQLVPKWRIRAFHAVRPETEIEDVLREMQQSGTHMATVVGPDGDILGIVFLEDILERLVGEVRDSLQRGT